MGMPVHQEKWITKDRGKRNRFTSMCNDHQFCSVPYDFNEEKQGRKEIEKERVSVGVTTL